MLKRITPLLMILLLMTGIVSVRADRLDDEVTVLLSEMTLEEKVGQMTQISIERVCKGYPAKKDPLELDPEALKEALVDYHIGSLFNVGTHAHTPERWCEIITQIQDVATRKTRLGIPVLYGIDAIHGASYTAGATLFPQSVGLAAAFDRELVRKSAEITAYEIRASGIPWNFNPVLGMGRQPLWPRFWETYGEDPYLAGLLGAAYVKGSEGADNSVGEETRAAACMKHYLGYSHPLSGKDRTPAWIPDRMLREIFVPPFQAAVDAGVQTVMLNSSEINGIPVHSSFFYLTTLLRQEMGFTGMACSDWKDIINLHIREKVADTPKEAVRMAVMAGVDMSMVPVDYSFYEYLVELVKEGAVPESRIDQAVRRILRLKMTVDLFNKPYPNPELMAKVGCDEFTAVNLQAARESITLLKNNGVLPLSRESELLVAGPTADRLSYQNGGWTITWQGDREDLYPREKLTVREALQEELGKHRVTYMPGTAIDSVICIDSAVQAARGKDAVILCLGEATYCETPGNINSLDLPAPQIELTQALEATGVPVIIVMIQGRPRVIRPVVDEAAAIVMAYLPGLEGGPALADILLGDVNPCGRLPFTYPRFTSDIVLYDHKSSENQGDEPTLNYHPQFPFGHGLSYTTFEYTALTLDKTECRAGKNVKASVTVTNTGERAGKESVLLYLSDLYASVTPSNKRLKGVEKISLEPGESKTVSFVIDENAMSFIGRENKRIIEPGEFRVEIGGLTAGFVLK